MKVLLVFPKPTDSACAADIFLPVPSNALATVAALTPRNIDLEIVNEYMRPLRPNLRADLVGISVMTYNAHRAYAIADAFRRRGVPVVLGGVHPTFCTDEALEHCDAVVCGEAEGVWPQVLADAQAGRLQRVYRRDGLTPPDEIPLPRWDVPGGGQNRKIKSLTTARGCPVNCDFCAVSVFHGTRSRGMNLDVLVEHIREVAARDRPRFFFFVDDNLTIDRDRAVKFFDLLVPLRLNWMSFASLDVARDESLLERAARSGCRMLFIGFESLNDENLSLFHKRVNRPDQYSRAIERIHAHGIAIQGSFIFGLDQDRPDVFRRTMEFCETNQIEEPQFNILTPMPGTRLLERLRREGRIVDTNWARYDMHHVVFEPLHMSRAQLQEGHNWAWKYAFSPTVILRRIRRIPSGRRGYNLVANFVQRMAVTRMLRQLRKSGDYPQTGFLL
ncbi:MAG: B12-binding domain-containing radical SAM protein [Candidatus Sumerlaeia bacterium]|nr:B12-binding domain-containing radical SAM protein [Candidatus Sumerlaeia bacterium]